MVTGKISYEGEGEPVWLTHYQRDSQPEGEREKIASKAKCRFKHSTKLVLDTE